MIVSVSNWPPNVAKIFIHQLSATRCADLRALGYGSQGKWPCSVLVERAVHIFLRTLREGTSSPKDAQRTCNQSIFGGSI